MSINEIYFKYFHKNINYSYCNTFPIEDFGKKLSKCPAFKDIYKKNYDLFMVLFNVYSDCYLDVKHYRLCNSKYNDLALYKKTQATIREMSKMLDGATVIEVAYKSGGFKSLSVLSKQDKKTISEFGSSISFHLPNFLLAVNGVRPVPETINLRYNATDEIKDDIRETIKAILDPVVKKGGKRNSGTKNLISRFEPFFHFLSEVYPDQTKEDIYAIVRDFLSNIFEIEIDSELFSKYFSR